MINQNRVLIDLTAIRDNYRMLKELVSPESDVVAVVKANAYGHGMIETAKALAEIGADRFAVALAAEGIELRLAGIQGEILVLGASTPRIAKECIKYELTQTVFTPEMVSLLDQEAVSAGKDALAHIKLDTGMNRIGLKTEEEAALLTEALRKAPHVRITGIYTHFADADHLTGNGETEAFSRRQLQRFNELRSCFDPSIPTHVSNSAMTLLSPEAWFDGVREGISLYGYPPVPASLALRPALSWMTEVVHVKTVHAGESVGYGCTYTAKRTMRIATVSVGYGDGYPRLLSNRGSMLIRGQRAPIVGRVCMDQTMVDVTEIPGVQPGDDAVLIGCQGEQRIDAEMLASWAETISYEILVGITSRPARIYLNEQ